MVDNTVHKALPYHNNPNRMKILIEAVIDHDFILTPSFLKNCVLNIRWGEGSVLAIWHFFGLTPSWLTPMEANNPKLVDWE